MIRGLVDFQPLPGHPCQTDDSFGRGSSYGQGGLGYGSLGIERNVFASLPCGLGYGDVGRGYAEPVAPRYRAPNVFDFAEPTPNISQSLINSFSPKQRSLLSDESKPNFGYDANTSGDSFAQYARERIDGLVSNSLMSPEFARTLGIINNYRNTPQHLGDVMTSNGLKKWWES